MDTKLGGDLIDRQLPLISARATLALKSGLNLVRVVPFFLTLKSWVTTHFTALMLGPVFGEYLIPLSIAGPEGGMR